MATEWPAAQVRQRSSLRSVGGRFANIGGFVLSRLRSMSVWSRITLVVIGFSVTVRAVWFSSTWFKEDDLTYRWLAHLRGFDLGYLFTRRDGHLMPSALTQVWFFEKLFGAAWWPIVVWCAILQAVAAVLAWMLFRALMGDRPLVLVLVVALLWNPLTLDSTMWWAVGMQFLPLQVLFFALILGVRRAIERYPDEPLTVESEVPLDSESPRWGRLRPHLSASVAAGLILLLALTFSEKAFLFVPFIAALSLATPLAPNVVAMPRRIRSAIAPTLSLGVAAAAWLALYVNTASNHFSEEFQAASLEATQIAGRNLVSHTLVPSLLGGPWRWLGAGQSFVLSLPTETAVTLSMLAAVAVVVVSVVRRPRVIALWGTLALYVISVIAVLAMPGSARVLLLGPLSGLRPHYTADAVLPALLVLGLALLGNRAEPIRPRGRIPWRWPVSKRTTESALTVVLSLALVASAAVSSTRLTAITRNAPAEAYSKEVLGSIRGTSGEIEMVQQAAPGELLHGGFFPNNRTRVIVQPLSALFRFPEVLTDPHMLTEQGQVVPALVEGMIVGDNTTCIATVGQGESTRIDLPSELWDWTWYATVSYRNTDSNYLETTFGDVTVGARTEPPVGSVTFAMATGGAFVEFGVLSGNLCVTQVRIGNPTPAEGRE